MKIVIDNLEVPPEERLKQVRAKNIRRLCVALNIICLPMFIAAFFLKRGAFSWVFGIGFVLLLISAFGQIKFAESKNPV